VYSTENITREALRPVMENLRAIEDKYGWEVNRNDRRVFIAIDTRDLPAVPDDVLRPAAELLRGWPKSSAVIMYDDTNPDQFEDRMAHAIAIAMAEHWPVVLDDHVTEPKVVYAPGQEPK
jgi:hypothetical protein